jgi:hypothetical protein
MPRNGSGTSSVINTFVIDTVADPDEVNANFTDVADQLTNSLPRDGQAGMNAPLPLENGTASLPALTFTSDPDTGIYRVSANKLGLALGGTGYPLDAGVVYAAKAGNYTALDTDNNAVHRYTATATVSLTAAATLATNWHYTVIADGGDVTIDPNAAETINGAATLRVPNGSKCFIICSGSAFFAFVSTDDAYGECRLTLSGGNLLLSRFNGRRLSIGGAGEVIPSAGITLAASGLTPATLYYIYAYMNSGTMTLEASATVPAVDATTGISIKTADATRTLVGMAYPETGPVFTDTAKKRFVRSWYNENGVGLVNNFTANRQTISTSFAELNPEIRCEALLWSGETFDATASGSCVNGASAGGCRSSLGYNSTTVSEIIGTISIINNVSGDIVPFTAQGSKSGLTQGYNYVTLLGAVQTGASTCTWYGDADARRTSIIARVRR